MQILKIHTRNRETGDLGEAAAAALYRRRHYKILARNYVAHGCEVDLICENREYIVFAEVKTRKLSPPRPGYSARPAAAVDREKQRKILRVARSFLLGYRKARRVRMDVVEVYVKEEPTGLRVVDTILLESAFYDTGI